MSRRMCCIPCVYLSRVTRLLAIVHNPADVDTRAETGALASLEIRSLHTRSGLAALSAEQESWSQLPATVPFW